MELRMGEKAADAPFWRPSATCRVCGDDSYRGSFLCERCRRVYRRPEHRRDTDGSPRKIDKEARFRAMKKQWDGGSFRCFYTGIVLSDKPGSRQSATWEHITPGKESTVVLVADLVNKMKANMTDREFKALVRALAVLFSGGAFDPRAFPSDPRRLA